MSLKDQIARQEERRRELEASLSALAAEFIEQMQAFGKEPRTVMDTTGDYSSERLPYDGDIVYTIGCRPTPVRAWSLVVKGVATGSSGPCIAITTTGELLVTEAEGLVDTTFKVANGYPRPEGGMLVYWNAGVYMGRYGSEPVKSWAKLRQRDQHNTLIEWAERVHLRGLDVIILPIEQAMLHVYNELHKRTL